MEEFWSDRSLIRDMNKDLATTVIGITTMLVGLGSVLALILDVIDSGELAVISATILSLGTGVIGYLTNKK